MYLRQMMRSQSDIALNLTKQILQTKNKGSNLLFLPLPIQLALRAIAAGSNGSTLDQLLCFLKSKSNDHLSSFSSEIIPAVFANGSAVGVPRLSFANGIWLDKSLPLKDSFKQTDFLISKEELKDLVEKASSESGFLEHHLPEKPVAVGELRIPKFKISSQFEACGVVKGLGLVLPFSYEADLREMADLPKDEHFYVSKIFHKGCVEVNEEGTEAAAATLMRGCCRPVDDRKIDFVVEHPFLFMIREDVTGLVLFTGHVNSPLEN
ncbi:hypothetical protein PTKIN_Ptkin16aG0014700 [Pterospermum kingtungense]